MDPWAVGGAALGGLVALASAVKAAPALWRATLAVSRVPRMVERIAAEFEPNTGGTLRDRIDGLDARMAELGERIVELKARVAALEVAVHGVRREML
jgi:hypothetical protein